MSRRRPAWSRARVLPRWAAMMARRSTARDRSRRCRASAPGRPGRSGRRPARRAPRRCPDRGRPPAAPPLRRRFRGRPRPAVSGPAWTRTFASRLPTTWRRPSSSPVTTIPRSTAPPTGRAGSSARRSATASVDDPSQVDGLAPDRPSLVEAGELEEIVHERGHPPALGADPLHRGGQGLGLGQAACAIEVGVAADGGQRRAELVGGVGDEPPEPVLAALHGVERPPVLAERGLDLVQHGVERRAQPADLGAVVRHAGPLRQVAGGDVPAVRRCARAGAAHGGRRTRQREQPDQREPARQQQRSDERADGGVDAGQRRRDRERRRCRSAVLEDQRDSSSTRRPRAVAGSRRRRPPGCPRVVGQRGEGIRDRRRTRTGTNAPRCRCGPGA